MPLAPGAQALPLCALQPASTLSELRLHICEVSTET